MIAKSDSLNPLAKKTERRLVLQVEDCRLIGSPESQANSLELAGNNERIWPKNMANQ